MVKVEFQRALRAAQEELKQRMAEYQATEKRILELRQVIASLSSAMNTGETPKRGGLAAAFEGNRMTDDVRSYFRANPNEIITAQDVASTLSKLGYDLSKYSSPLATIGVVLGRLRESGELEAAQHLERRGYRLAVKNDDPISAITRNVSRHGTVIAQSIAERKKK